MRRPLVGQIGALGSAILLALALAGPPAVSAGDPCFHRTDNRPAVSAAATSAITIGDCSFGPTVAYVPVGAQVTWRNTSGSGHEVVGSNLTWGAHDKVLAMGDTIGWSFEKAGVYAYSCMIHPGMTGAIVVGDGLAALAPGGAAPVADTAAQAAATSETAAGTGAPAWAVLAGTAGVAVGVLALAALAARSRSARPADDTERMPSR